MFNLIRESILIVRFMKERLSIEKCVLAEEMKILFHDKQLTAHDMLDRHEESLKQKIQST